MDDILVPICQEQMEEGKVNFEKGIYKAALKNFRIVVSFDPENYEARFFKALAGFHQFKIQYKYDDDINEFTTLIEKNSHLSEALYYRGQLYNKEMNFSSAIDDFTQSIYIKPDSFIVYYHRGVSYFKSKQFDKSIIDLSYFIENYNFANTYEDKKTKVEAIQYLGFSHHKLMNYNQAIEYFSTIIEILNSPDSFVNRGYIHLSYGENSKALADFESSLKFDGNPNENYLLEIFEDVCSFKNIRGERSIGYYVSNLAFLLKNNNSYLNDDLYQEACECIEIYPSFYLGYFFRATYHFGKGTRNKMLVDLEMSLKLKPNNKISLALLNESNQ